jgi:hypothetical protein
MPPEEVEKPELYESMWDFSVAATDLIKQNQSFDKVPGRKEYVVNEKDDALETSVVEKPAWGKFGSNFESFERIDAFEEAVQIFLEDGELNDFITDKFASVSSEKSGIESWLMIKFRTLLRYLYEEENGVSVSKEAFNELYLEFEELVVKQDITWKIWSVLEGVKAPETPLELADNIVFRKIKDSERKALAQDSESSISHMRGTPWSNTLVLDIRNPQRSKDEVVENIVLSLRLFQNLSPVKYNFVTSEPLNRFKGVRTGSSGEPRHSGANGEVIQLTEEFMREFREFYENFSSLLNEDSLELPLSRYQQAFTRSSPEDNLIDLVIALEALLTKPEEKHSITHKLGQRATLIATKKEINHEEFMSKTKNIYRERSKVVHGSEDEIDREYLNEVYETVRKCFLGALQRMNEENLSKTELVQELDRELIDA